MQLTEWLKLALVDSNFYKLEYWGLVIGSSEKIIQSWLDGTDIPKPRHIWAIRHVLSYHPIAGHKALEAWKMIKDTKLADLTIPNADSFRPLGAYGLLDRIQDLSISLMSVAHQDSDKAESMIDNAIRKCSEFILEKNETS